MAKKKRAWANLKGTLPDASENQPDEYTQKVLVAKDARQGQTLAEMAQEWATLEEEEEFEDRTRYERNIKYRALELRILEELETVKAVAGTDIWRGEGQTFSPKHMLNVRITDPRALRDWVEQTGQQDQLTLPIGRLKAIVGEALDTDAAANMTPAQRSTLKAGDPASGAPPPGVAVALHTTVHHTSGTRKRSAAPDDDEVGPF